ncbi:MAG: hypothetical protein LQ350_002565 [Teloschistes chrysophthalmus]|nr:MAG: hypothetical protein LQ350_002565 [Niorma chrysophthalma]
MPPEVNQPTIYINAPNGTSNVRNPLYTYAFHPLPSSSDFPPLGGSNYGTSINAFHNTVRYPDANGQSQPDLVNKQLQANAASNVDRLFALWQAVYPEANVSPQINDVGTYTNDPGKSEDGNTPLTPFHSDDSGNFWTSSKVWSTKTFGYAYPEIIDWGVNRSQLTTNVKARLNALYNPTGSIPQRSVSTDGSSSLTLTPNSMNVQWFANIRINRSDIASPFFVHFFLGSPPVDPATWSFDPSLIGSHSVIDTPLLRSRISAFPMYGQIPLNHALLEAGHADLAPEKIVPLLTSGLNWRLQGTNDSSLNISAVPSLKIHVVAQAVKPRVAEDEFPEYGQFVVYREITLGKDGGVGSGDDVD